MDEPRVGFRKRRVAEPHAVHHAGPKVLHEDVARPRQLADDLAPAIRPEVERHAPLAAVEQPEQAAGAVGHGRNVAIVVAAGSFDLDHLGAKIGQKRGTERPGKHAGQVQHADARQTRIGHGPLLRDLAKTGSQGEAIEERTVFEQPE